MHFWIYGGVLLRRVIWIFGESIGSKILMTSENEKEEDKKSKKNKSTREDKKVKAVGMKDSGLKLLAEATVLHPIESEVEKIEQTEYSTPNVNVKLGIDNAPKKNSINTFSKRGCCTNKLWDKKNAFQQDVYQPLFDRMLESASRRGGVFVPGWVSAPGVVCHHSLRQTTPP